MVRCWELRSLEKTLYQAGISLAHTLGQLENCAQDAQKGRPARPQRAKRRRRYAPHFVWPFTPRMDLGERISPARVSDFRKVLVNVEPLSDARTMTWEKRVSARTGWAGEKGDFFSIL
jgi:hypothetical protein